MNGRHSQSAPSRFSHCREWALWLVLGLMWLTGCGSANETGTKSNEGSAEPTSSASADIPESGIRFEEITKACGIHFTPRNGREAGRFAILESLGAGVAILDFDLDARPDIIALGGGAFDESGSPTGTDCGVFQQRAPLRFEDVAKQSGIDTRASYTHGVAVGDWNNDGFEDIVLTGFRSVRLYLNAGDGTFLDVTDSAKLSQDAWSTSAAFLDADNDGDLELYVVNYVDWKPEDRRECIVKGHRDICPPGEFAAQTDDLYRNDGDGGFTEVAKSAGLSEGGKGLAVIAGDVDLDGDTDIYVANDTTANFLYLNDGGGKFVESGLYSGCALGMSAEAEGSMGIEFADFNLDGDPDIWVSNYENQSFAMYQSRGSGNFQHVSSITGISSVGQLYVGFGTAGFDADLDGDEDIFAANGHVMYESAGGAPIRQLPLIYENIAGKEFRNVAKLTGDYGSSAHMGRGVAAGDLDGDGRVDLVVSHTNEPISVLRNTSERRGGWVSLNLVGRDSNRSAIGAFAVIDGKKPRLRKGGGSYLSDSADTLNWGVAEREDVMTVTIQWPSGRQQSTPVFANSANFVLELVVK